MTEMPPPWIVLPHLGANDPPTQGAEEAYVNLQWLPFWQTLDAQSRGDYLDRWDASDEWRDVIMERYDPEGFDIEEDARESAAWAAARAKGTGPR